MQKMHLVLPVSALVAIASLSGCASGVQSANDGGDGDGTVLTMSGFSGDETAEALIAAFEDDNPGVTINYSGIPYPQILTQINTQLVSGTASDIVSVFPGNGNPITAQTLAKGDYLADLSSSDWASEFNDANQEVMGADGKILMAANNFTIIPAIYNTQALEAVGATAPTTFTEVIDLCSTAATQGKVAYALAGVAGGNFTFLPYALTASLVYGPDRDFDEKQAAGDVSFADSEWATALDEYQQMIDAGCFTADATGTSIETAQGQVAQGDAVGIVTVSNQIGDIQTMAPDGTTFETAALPATDDASETILPVGLGAGYGVNAKSDNVEMAQKFIDFYMSDAGLQIAIDKNSIFPSIVLDGFEPSDTLSGVTEQAQGDQTAAFPDQKWPNSVVNQVYSDELQKFIGGQTSAGDMLDAMDVAYAG